MCWNLFTRRLTRCLRFVKVLKCLLGRKSSAVKDFATGTIPSTNSGIIPLALHLVRLSPHLVFFSRHPAALSAWDNDSNSLTSIETLLVFGRLDFLEFSGASAFHFVSKLSVLLISVLFVQSIVDGGSNWACSLRHHISKFPGSLIFLLHFDLPSVLSCTFFFSEVKYVSLKRAEFFFLLISLVELARKDDLCCHVHLVLGRVAGNLDDWPKSSTCCLFFTWEGS